MRVAAVVNPEEILTLVEPVTLQKVYETAQGMAVAQARAVELQASARASTANVATGPAIQVVRQTKQTEPPRQRSADLNCYHCGTPQTGVITGINGVGIVARGGT